MNGVSACRSANFAALWKRAAAALRHEAQISDLQVHILEEELAKAQLKNKKLEAENILLRKKVEAAVLPAFSIEASTGVKVNPMNEAKRIMHSMPALKKQAALSWWKDANRLLHVHRGDVSVRALCGHRGVEWTAKQETPPETYAPQICAACWDLAVEPKPTTSQAGGGTEVARRLYSGIISGYANEGDLLEAFVDIQTEAFSDGLSLGAMIAALTEGRLIGQSARENNQGMATRHSAEAAGARLVHDAIQRRIDEANEVQK